MFNRKLHMPVPNAAHPILFYNNTLYIVRKNNENPWFYRSISLLLRYLSLYICVCMQSRVYDFKALLWQSWHCNKVYRKLFNKKILNYMKCIFIQFLLELWTNILTYINTVCDNRMCLWMRAWVFCVFFLLLFFFVLQLIPPLVLFV